MLGGPDGVRTFLPQLISFIGVGRGSNEIEAYCQENLEVAASSIQSGLVFLRQNGFIIRSSKTEYRATPVALSWAKDADGIDLARFLHCKLRFFGEILDEMSEAETVGELLSAAQARYGISALRREDVRRRVHLLRALGLLEEAFGGRHQLTAEGLAFRDSLPLEAPSQIASNGFLTSSILNVDGAVEAMAVVDRLRAESRNSAEPTKFEEAICDAFRLIGFETELLGGSGRTDVLASSIITNSDGYTVAVDAKTTGGGTLNEGAVNLAVLSEHRRLHSADYSAVVGWRFSPRLERLSADNNVVLITADQLCELVGFQSRTPLALNALQSLFGTPGLASLNSVQAAFSVAQRSQRLVGRVLELLSNEATGDDEITQGALSVEGLYLIMRSEPEAPSTEEIREVLEFLETPFVAAVKRSSNGRYHVVEPPRLTGHRLRCLGSSMNAQ